MVNYKGVTMSGDMNVWNRKCKTKGCNGLARYKSDYCIRCMEVWNLNSKKVKK
jgi:hypothetical protein